MSRFVLFISLAFALLAVALVDADLRPAVEEQESGDEALLHDVKPFKPNQISEEEDVESENAIIPNNDEECAGLEDNGTLFCDFCIASRDHIIGQLRRAINQAVSNVFALFFKVFEKLRIDATRVKQIEAEQLEEEKRQEEAAKKSGEMQVSTKMAQERGGPIQFLLKLLRGLADKFARFVIEKIEQLQRKFGIDKLKFATGGACDMLEAFDRHISAEFIKTRDEIASYAFDFQHLKLDDIKCITIRRLVRLKGICNVISKFTDPLRFLSRSFIPGGRR